VRIYFYHKGTKAVHPITSAGGCSVAALTALCAVEKCDLTDGVENRLQRLGVFVVQQ
jgi:hypothetical protein